MARAKWWAETRCDTHGKVEAGDHAQLKRVIVSLGKTKKEKFYSGCPQCKMTKEKV